MKRIDELEQRIESLKNELRGICRNGAGLPNRLLKCVEITDFLLNHDKDDVVIKPYDKRIFAVENNYYILNYVFDGRLETALLYNILIQDYPNLTVMVNCGKDLILSADNPRKFGEHYYFKFDKQTQCIVDITDIYKHNKEIQLNLANSLTMEVLKAENEELKAELEKLKRPKKETVAKKNVKKMPKNDEKNVEKKATKKKESKNG